jgi:hypothetical protein
VWFKAKGKDVLVMLFTFLLYLLCFSLVCAHEFIEESNFFRRFDIDQGHRYLILLISRDGLANRLRTIADFYAICQETGRELVVSWQPSVECNARFEDLFDLKATSKVISNFQVLNYDVLSSNTIQDEEVYRKLAIEAGISFYLQPRIPDFFLDKDSKIYSSEVTFVLTKFHGLVASESKSCEEYLEKRSNFLRSLQPLDFLRKYVHDMKREYFAGHTMVSLHYRVHREEFDWAVVPPMLESGLNAVTFDESAGLTKFEQVVRQIMPKQPHARFLFVSNDADAKEHMISTFGDQVVILRGSLSRSDVAGMQFALLEWLFLAESDLIVHTYGSSFAQEAAQVHGATLVGLWHHVKIYSRHPKLKYCGIPHYMKKLSDQGTGTKRAYSEGTVDNRVIDDEYYELKPCTMIDQWGLQDLWCSE